jgi:hypothetical protein
MMEYSRKDWVEDVCGDWRLGGDTTQYHEAGYTGVFLCVL